MEFLTQHRAEKRPWRVLLALLCVLLVAVTGTVQIVHSHPAGDVSHADCSLCATAHVVAEVSHSPTPIPAVAVVAVLTAEPEPFTPAAVPVFALFTRPPPVDNVRA